jgi:hypothetical protein
LSRKGQATIELLPSILVFVLVISAGLAYFRVMRAAAIREEAARNLAFEKMDHSGTLTTQRSPDNGRSGEDIVVRVGGSAVPGGELPAIDSRNNPFIDQTVTCYQVIPGGDAKIEIPVQLRQGVTMDAPVKFLTYSTVCRR